MGDDLSFLLILFTSYGIKCLQVYTDEAGQGDDVTEIKAHTKTLMQCALWSGISCDNYRIRRGGGQSPENSGL